MTGFHLFISKILRYRLIPFVTNAHKKLFKNFENKFHWARIDNSLSSSIAVLSAAKVYFSMRHLSRYTLYRLNQVLQSHLIIT